MKINDVLKAIHEVGGCDATDEWSKGYDAGVDAAYSAVAEAFDAKEKIKNKVVIPGYVADFINKAKPIMSLYSAMYNLFHFGSISMETPSKDGAVRDWVEKNEETFARAWLDGYTVEPQLYTVTFANGIGLVIDKDSVTKRYFFGSQVRNIELAKLTKSEIESVDPILMEIAKEVESNG